MIKVGDISFECIVVMNDHETTPAPAIPLLRFDCELIDRLLDEGEIRIHPCLGRIVSG